MWSHVSSQENAARPSEPRPAPAPGKSSRTQKLPPAQLSSAELRAAVPAVAATRDPQVERDIAAGMGFLLGEYGGQAAAATGTPGGKAAAPAGPASGPSSKSGPGGASSKSGPGGASSKSGKAAKPPKAPKPPEITPSQNLVGRDVYLATEANGQDESGDVIVVAGDQWGVAVDQLDATKLKRDKVKGRQLYDATFLVQVQLADGARLWFPRDELIAAAEGGLADHAADAEGQRHDKFAARFNQEMKPILGSFGGGLTHASAMELFTDEQIEALWGFLLTKIIPGGLFSTMTCRPALTVPQRTLVAAHIVAHGVDFDEKLDPSEDSLARARADFCYHWVQLVWNYAGINDGKGANLGVRGDRGPTDDLSYGAGKSLYSDEKGNPLGQTPVAEAGTLGYYGKNKDNPARTARRQSLSEAQLTEILRPGDWIWIYNGNGSAGGGHSVVFAGWTTATGEPLDKPVFQAPENKAGREVEHDGELAEVRVAHGLAYSQRNNNPQTEEQAGGKLHSLRLGPLFYRELDGDESKNLITPVYCVTRPDPASHPAGTAEEILQYNRGAAIKDNLAYLKRNGLGLAEVRAHLARTGAAQRRSGLAATLDAKQGKILDELIAAEDDSIEHVTELAALCQRTGYAGKGSTGKINGLLEKLHLDLEALGASGAPRAGELPELGQLGALAFAANQRFCEAKALDPAALRTIVGEKAAAAAAGKRGKEASADDVAALERAERSSAGELVALGYAVARWQVLDGKAATGWVLDVIHQLSKAQLAAARLDGGG